jgi:hypothetical protein
MFSIPFRYVHHGFIHGDRANMQKVAGEPGESELQGVHLSENFGAASIAKRKIET